MVVETAKLEYKEMWPGCVKVFRNGIELGEISGGEEVMEEDDFWEASRGETPVPEPTYSYWLRDKSCAGWANSKPLTTINQAKAFAEYYFNKENQ